VRLGEVNNILFRLETECDVHVIKLDGVEVWPLVRSVLWTHLSSTDKNSKFSVLSQYSARELISAVAARLTALSRINIFSQKFLSSIRHVEVVFIGRTNHLTKVVGSRAWYDRVLDPIQDIVSSLKKTEKFVIGIHKSGKLATRSRKLNLYKLHMTSMIQGLETSGLMSKLEETGMNPLKIKSEIERASQDFLSGSIIFQKYLDARPDVQYIFVSVWYSYDMMGLIFAARQRSICVIDVQHGAEYAQHGMYSNMQHHRLNPTKLVPNLFWTWGQFSGSVAQATFSHGKGDDVAIVGGYPWHEFRDEILKSARTVEFRKHNSIMKKRILVSLQPPTLSSNSRIPKFVQEFMQSDASNDFQINFRVHPNDRAAAEEVRSLGSISSRAEYWFSDTSQDLVSTLRQSDFHITAFSSVCYDAMSCGVPSLLYGQEAIEYYKDEIASKVFMWTEGNLIDLLRFLNSPENNVYGFEKYFESSLSLSRKAVLNIFAHS